MEDTLNPTPPSQPCTACPIWRWLWLRNSQSKNAWKVGDGGGVWSGWGAHAYTQNVCSQLCFPQATSFCETICCLVRLFCLGFRVYTKQVTMQGIIILTQTICAAPHPHTLIHHVVILNLSTIKLGDGRHSKPYSSSQPCTACPMWRRLWLNKSQSQMQGGPSVEARAVGMGSPHLNPTCGSPLLPTRV